MRSHRSTTLDSFFTRGLRPGVVTAVLLLVGASLALAGQPDKGNRGNPGVLPPQSNPHGKSYGEWAVAWWQWGLGIPGDRSPITDATGEFCAEGQSGPVWFLAGTFGGDVERNCTIPTGKSIFMPVFNWIFGSGVFDCDPTVPGVPCDVPGLQAVAAANTEAAEELDVSLDTVPVQNLRSYRASSPGPFPITYPENSVFGVPSGTYFPQVTDGYWLMLAPLPVGNHDLTLHVKTSEIPGWGVMEFTVVYHLTVTPGSK